MSARHLLLYDGDCGFCHESVRFVLARDRSGLFRFAALQGDAAAKHLAPFGGRPATLDTLYVLEDAWGPRPLLHARSDAVLFVARALGLPWRVLAALPRGLRDRAYDLVARHRRSLIGTRSCPVPASAERDRFL